MEGVVYVRTHALRCAPWVGGVTWSTKNRIPGRFPAPPHRPLTVDRIAIHDDRWLKCRFMMIVDRLVARTDYKSQECAKK